LLSCTKAAVRSPTWRRCAATDATILGWTMIGKLLKPGGVVLDVKAMLDAPRSRRETSCGGCKRAAVSRRGPRLYVH
jgi:hypothetical protein